MGARLGGSRLPRGARRGATPRRRHLPRGWPVLSVPVAARTSGAPVSILRFDRTCFGYARGFALRDVELSIEPGELVALVGPNGSGKSTLLRLALGLHAATAGRIEIGGRDLGGHTRRSLAREAAFVPQGVSLD
ncbi:MAG: ATP-binding cassette domain-containing protein, partial [Myxococcales bacterium]|nr:ATP-binding cassette domain-containing protein [Myxococcales bacterium]